MAPNFEKEPSNYIQTLTRYLSNIMNSVLLGLPTEIKELIYFDALSHAATMILVGHLFQLYEDWILNKTVTSSLADSEANQP